MKNKKMMKIIKLNVYVEVNMIKNIKRDIYKLIYILIILIIKIINKINKIIDYKLIINLILL